MSEKTLKFFYWYLPSTFDTYKSDRSDSIPVLRNIYAPLITNLNDGKIEGMIAESWTVDPAGRTWRFKIKKGLFFDDGMPINAKVVLSNFRRIMWLTKGDRLPLNMLIPEVRTWDNYDAPLRDVYLKGDEIVFRLAKRATNFCEILDQAIYSIANPKCFGKNGEWLDDGCVSASGAYKVRTLSKEAVVLESRHVYAAARYAPETVEIRVPSGQDFVDDLLAGKCDLAVQMINSLGKDARARLKEAEASVLESIPTQMYFMELNHSRSPFSDPELRRSVRDAFFFYLRDSGLSSYIKVDHSFIPPGAGGYLHFDAPNRSVAVRKGSGVVTIISTPIPENDRTADQMIKKGAEEALIKALRLHGFAPRIVRLTGAEWYKSFSSGDFDVIYRGSGISVNDPFSSLRMMFDSAVGARIPDPSGKIPGIIKKAESISDPQERRKMAQQVNKNIYDNAAVLNFMHSGRAYVYSKRVELPHYNSASDVIEFRTINWRPETAK